MRIHKLSSLGLAGIVLVAVLASSLLTAVFVGAAGEVEINETSILLTNGDNPMLGDLNVGGYDIQNATAINGTQYYVGSDNRTDVLANPQKAWDYLIYPDGSNYYAISGATGQIDNSSASALTVIQYAVANSPASGGLIAFAPDVIATGTLTLTRGNLSFVSEMVGYDFYYISAPSPQIQKVVIDSTSGEIDKIKFKGITINELIISPLGNPIQELLFEDCCIYKYSTWNGLMFIGDGGATSWFNNVRFVRCRLTEKVDDSGTSGLIVFRNGYHWTELTFDSCTYELAEDNAIVFYCEDDASVTLNVLNPRFMIGSTLTGVKLFHTEARSGAVTNGMITRIEGGRAEGNSAFNVWSMATSANDMRLHLIIDGLNIEVYTGTVTIYDSSNVNWYTSTSNHVIIKNCPCWGGATFAVGNLPPMTTTMYIQIKNNPQLNNDKPRVIKSEYWEFQGAAIGTAGRVYLTPLIIKDTVTVDRIGLTMDDPTAGNWTVGIYADNGDTPQGGDLIVESASTSKGASWTSQEITITPTTLQPGTYWLAIQSDEVTTVIMRTSSMYSGITLNPRYYDRGGGYGALTNPCPALTATSFAANMWVRTIQP